MALPDVSLERVLGMAIEVEGCLEWGGYVSDRNRPQIRVNYKCYPVRRLVYQLVNGKIDKAKWVYSTCGNPTCVHPDHLKTRTRSEAFQGTKKSIQTRQKIAYIKRASCPVTQEMVDEIRASSEKGTVIAERLGIHHSTVSKIRLGKSWKTYAGNPFVGLGARA